MNLSIDEIELPKNLKPEDKWILTTYNDLVAEVTGNMEKYELGLAAQKLYEFLWETYCDWYIELTKTRLRSGGTDKLDAENVLAYVLSGTLKLLHPFMPFITEEIYQTLPGIKSALIVAPWPKYESSLDFSAIKNDVESVMAAIHSVRNARAEMNVPLQKAKALLLTEKRRFSKYAGELQKLGLCVGG